jgi:hypothetical protein
MNVQAGVDAATCLREISSLCEDKACVYIVEYEKKDPLEWQRRVALNIYVWHIPFRDNPKCYFCSNRVSWFF